MKFRILWMTGSLTLWLTISLILQATGLSLLTSHLLAMVIAFPILLVARHTLTRRSTMNNPTRQ